MTHRSLAPTILRHLALALLTIVVLFACTPKPIPAGWQLSSIDFLDREIADEPTFELYDARVAAYRKRGDEVSLRKALTDIDSAEALGARTSWKEDERKVYPETFRLRRAQINCALSPLTGADAHRTACLDGVDGVAAHDPSSDAHLSRALAHASNGGDMAIVEESVRAAREAFAAERRHDRGASQFHTRIAEIYVELAKRAAGTPDEARYTDILREARRATAAAKVEDEPRAESAAARADRREYQRRRRATTAARVAVAHENQERADRERRKGIAQFGACEICNGRGVITRHPLAAYGDHTHPPDYDEKCLRCGGSGFRGPDYSIFRSNPGVPEPVPQHKY